MKTNFTDSLRSRRARRNFARTSGLAFLLIGVGACASSSAITPATPTAAARPPARRDSAVQTAVAGERAVGGTVQSNAVAVPPFRIARNDTMLEPLAYALADMLTTDLSLSRQLTLVERARLGEVLRELQLAGTGRVDSSTAPRVGRLISARRLILGAIDTLPGSRDLRIGVRLANVQSGLVERSIDARAPLNDVLSAEKTLAFRVFDELGIVLSPAERALIAQRPTANLAAILAFGRGVRFQILGDYASAAREFRRAQQLDPNFREAGTRATATTTLASAPPPTTPAAATPPTTGQPPVTPPANPPGSSTGKPPVTSGPPTTTTTTTTTPPATPPTTPPATSNPLRPNTSTTTTEPPTTPPTSTPVTTPVPTLTVPGFHPTGPGVTAIIDRINRPLDIITSITRAAGTPADPSFPSTVATVILTVIRP